MSFAWPRGFQHKILHNLFSHSTITTTCSTHFSILHLITISIWHGEQMTYEICSIHLCVHVPRLKIFSALHSFLRIRQSFIPIQNSAKIAACTLSFYEETRRLKAINYALWQSVNIQFTYLLLTCVLCYSLRYMWQYYLPFILYGFEHDLHPSS
jgi:hypothetical protein